MSAAHDKVSAVKMTTDFPLINGLMLMAGNVTELKHAVTISS